MNPKFFDRVKTHNSYNNFCENYFYLPFISGRLGFRTFKVVNQQLIVKQAHKKCSAKQIFISALKIASYFTPVMPVIFVSKCIFRKNVRVSAPQKIPTPIPSKTIDPNQVVLDQPGWIIKKFCLPRGTRFTLSLALPALETNQNIFSDPNMRDLILGLENDPEVCFLAQSYYVNGGDEEYTKPTSPEGFSYLQKALSAAFALGKKMVVARFGDANDQHAPCAAFSGMPV